LFSEINLDFRYFFIFGLGPQLIATFTHQDLASIVFSVDLTLKLGKIQRGVEAIHTDCVINLKIGLEVDVLVVSISHVVMKITPKVCFIVKVLVLDLQILFKFVNIVIVSFDYL